MDFFGELTQTVRALEAAGIDYALCGGVALAIHGAPRATQDIDLLVRPENLTRLAQVARACGFIFESLPMEFSSGVTIQRFTKLIEGQPLMLDVLLVTGPLESIWADRQTANFENGRISVVSREGLISLKLAAARPQDLVDIARLKEVSRD